MMFKISNIGIILSIFIISSLCEDIGEAEDRSKSKVRQYLQIIDDITALTTQKEFDKYNGVSSKPSGGNVMADEMILPENVNNTNNNNNNKKTLEKILMKPRSHDPCKLFYDCVDKFNYCKKKVNELKDEKYFLIDALQTLQRERNLYKLKAQILERRLRHCKRECNQNQYYEDLAANQSIIIAEQNTTIRNQAATILSLQNQLQQCQTDLSNCGGGGCGTCPADLTACRDNATTAVGTIAGLQGQLTTCNNALTTCQSGSSCATCSNDLAACQQNATTAVGTIADKQALLDACIQNATTAVGTIAACTTNLQACQANASDTTTKLTQCKDDLTACQANATAAVGTIAAKQALLDQCLIDEQAASNLATTYFAALTTCESNYDILNDQYLTCITNRDACIQNATTAVTTIASLNGQLTNCSSYLSTARNFCSVPVIGITIDTIITVTGSQKYYFHNDLTTGKTFEGAAEFCRTKRMVLVSIEGSGELNLLRSKIAAYLAATGDQPNNFYWTSLNNLESNAQWKWGGTGSNATISPTTWYSGLAPTDMTKNCAGVYLPVLSNLNAKYQPDLCSYKARFICEMPEPCNSIEY